MKKAKDEIIRNYFTKYVETALNRARRDCMKNEQKRNGMEAVREPELLSSMQQGTEGVVSSDVIYGVPWEPGAVRLFLIEAVGACKKMKKGWMKNGV